MNNKNDIFKKVRRDLNRRYGTTINRNENVLNTSSDVIRKSRDRNSKNVKNLLLKIKNVTKEKKYDNEIIDLLNESKEQLIFLQDKNKSLSSDLIEKINKIKKIYQNNKNLWTEIGESLETMLDEGNNEEQPNKSKTLENNNNQYMTFNYLHKELIQ